MKDLALTLYDTIAYFVPGTIVVWSLVILVGQTASDLQQFSVNLPDFVLGIIALTMIYVVGHILHAIANLTIDLLPSGGYPPRDYFPTQFDKDFPEPFRSILYRHIVASFHVQDEQHKKSATVEPISEKDSLN